MLAADVSGPAPNPSTPSVLGHFLLAWGPEAAEWARRLDGFTHLSGLAGPAEQPVHVAIRGAAESGRTADGARWVAVADLVEGHLDDGAGALGAGEPPQRRWRGRFAQVAWHPEDGRVAAITDHFGTVPIYVLSKGGSLLVSTDLRLLARSPLCGREVDPTSVFHFLNFAIVPAPRTIFRDIRRLEPSTRLRRAAGSAPTEDRYFVPEYPEDLRGPDAKLAGELRDRIVATVELYGPRSQAGWGCFLSGGTDSSSVVSILARREGRGKVKSFSIGFAEEGYDELGYARLAAGACGADPTFAKVSREQAQSLVGRIVDGYDQPFGNASAIPTLACADLAHEHGIGLMLAGDGGDEIFGGNQRYAKDQVMEAWYGMPGPLKALARKAGGAVGGSHIHFLNRIENFFERSSLPNPDRFYTDDSFASDYYEELLSPALRAEVSRDASLDFMRSVYRLGRTGGPLHRIMRLDLLMAIAQNDIPKVHGATRTAGVSVRFPFLDPELVSWSNRLTERHKVRGVTKRFLFKQAMREILPQEIIKKKKQGFGLPTAVWLREDKAFQDTVRDAIFDKRAAERGWFQPACIEKLLDEHVRGSWDHADDIWRIFVLELWVRKFVDGS